MGCAGCQKNRKANPSAYMVCPGCHTTLHGPLKDMPTINGTRICGPCDRKYKIFKDLENLKAKKEPVKRAKTKSTKAVSTNDLTKWKD